MDQPQTHDPRAEATFTESTRREHARYAVELDLHFGSEHNFYQGLIENLSAGGVFVATHQLREVGERFDIRINLPGGAVQGVGEVRWVREYSEASDFPPGMGIRFITLDPAAELLIGSFLGEREPIFWDD